MTRLRSPILVLLVIVATGVGCREWFVTPPPPPPPEPQGPQTKDAVLAEIRPAVAPLRNTLHPGSPGISDMQREQVLRALRDATIAYGGTDFGREALRELGYEIMDIARQASEIPRYRLVLACIDAVEVLAMESQFLKRLGARADLILDKPAVRVKGFLEDHANGQLHVFLELLNHKTGAVESIEAREGDEFNQLRLIRITGRNQAVIFEYLRMPGLFFEVEAF